MFSAIPITVGFVLVFGGVALAALAEKLGQRWLTNIGFLTSTVASIYCVAAGAFLWGDWVDPFASASVSTEQVNRAAGAHGGRGGLVILAIKFWPYVLCGTGAFFAYNGISILRSETVIWIRARKRESGN